MIKNEVNAFYKFYNVLYNNEYECTELVNMGDELMQKNQDVRSFSKDLAIGRGDICTSDREIASFVLTYLHSRIKDKNVRKQLSEVFAAD